MGLRGIGYLFLPTYTQNGQTLQSGVWWWKFRGKKRSTGCRTEKDAERWRLDRLIEMRQGHLVKGASKPLTFDEMERLLLERWELDGRTGLLQSKSALKHLNRHFSGYKVEEIAPSLIQSYCAQRQRAGAAAGTINVELAILHRGMAVAHELGRLASVPRIRHLPGVKARTGIIEAGDFQAIVGAIPERYRPVLHFLYWTGWRRSEALSLTWSRVDLAAGEFRLGAENSKTREPRLLSFRHVPQLRELLETQRQGPVLSPYVFPGRAGRPLDRSALGKAWRAACRSVGLPGALIHDLRRTMVRDMRRAGVPLAVAMGTVGHTDLAVHQGYSVVAGADQDEGMAKVVALRAGEPLQRRIAQFAIGGK